MLTFPFLTNTVGNLAFSMNLLLTLVVYPELAIVGGFLEILDNAVLNMVSFPVLTSNVTAGILAFSTNPFLTLVACPALARCWGNYSY
jgi:hypothetical protein